MDKDKFPFTETVLEELEEVMYQQDEKGMEKYNQALDPMDDKWDWLQMAEEELADLAKYLKAEQHKRNQVMERVSYLLNDIENQANIHEMELIKAKVEQVRYYLGIIIPSQCK